MRPLLTSLSLLLILSGCSFNNIKEDDSLKQYFDQHKVTGSFGMFDNTRGDVTVYDLGKFTDSVYTPASTFKIVNSLIGLETGIVSNDSAVIQWNGTNNFNPNCNKDLPMYEAFRQSCVPWFQELARRVGKDTMQFWLDSIGYGSRYKRAVINTIDTFWLDNSIKISPDEQLGLMKKLYFDQLPFKAWTQREVKSMMLVESNDKYKLSYKTGWGRSENGNSIGWVVGWIEENKHPYPFVLQIESADPNQDIVATRLEILDKIFRHYGFKEGKK
ncbi:MAG TPA: penicillin-binding transpeptidase domain-containing protein [Chitinophagaceae bacterium]